MDKEVEIFKRKYWNKIKRKKNVHGFSGVLWNRERGGKLIPGTKVIRIYVTKKEPISALSKKDIVPRVLSLGNETIETDIVEIARMKYMDDTATSPSDHQKRYRPYPAGVSCTALRSTACTLSWYARKAIGETVGGLPKYQVYVMLNNHCGGLENKAEKGEPWVQPSPYDGGTKNDIIARYAFGVPTKYERYTCPLRELAHKMRKLLFMITHFRAYEAVNHVDISFGIPENINDISYSIFGIEGRVVGKGEHKRGTKIIKSGRTSGVTTGYIEDPSWNGFVQGRRGVAYYEDVVLCRAECRPGDSGSPVVSEDGLGNLLYHGALFAGNDQGYLIYCKWEYIEKEANVEIITY